MTRPRKAPLPGTTPPADVPLTFAEMRFIGHILALLPNPSAIEACRRATGITDNLLALSRCQGLLQSEPVLTVLVLLLAQEATASLFNQVGLTVPPLDRYLPQTISSLIDGTEIADNETRKRFWTALMTDAGASPADRLRASDLLAKAEGDYRDSEESESTFDMVAMLERLEQRGEARTAKETAKHADLVRVGALPASVDLNTLQRQLHPEWFRIDGSIRTDTARKRILIETIPPESSTTKNSPLGSGQAKQQEDPRPSLQHHLERSKPAPGTTASL